MSSMHFHLLYLQIIFVLAVPILLQFIILLPPTVATWSGNETDHMALQAFKSKIVHDPEGVTNLWNDSVHFCNWQGVTCGKLHRRVTILDLQARRLTGFISPHIGNLSFLQFLRLNNNTFQGKIPPQVGNLFRLRELALYNNLLTGEIPANLSHCSNLWYFRIGRNKLVGKLPTELSSLSKLIYLTVGVNNFSGEIPSFIGNFTSLKIISMIFNAFTGIIPEALGQLQNLTFLSLGANKLSGKIPSSIYNLSSLTVLNLIENQLSGDVPTKLGSMFPQLQHLVLSGNQFVGPLPVSLHNFSNIVLLELGINHFSGKISIDFKLLPRLNVLLLNDNNLGTGEPDEMDFIPSLINCTNFQILDVASNQLKRTLPKSIGNLSATLSHLDLSQNHIYGEIPSEISHLVGLTWLSLGDNKFKGRIPYSIGNLQNLQLLNLSSSLLEGDVPNTIGNLSFLIYFVLNDNILQGNVPVTLGNCQRLLLLDLSSNNLTGAIPRELFGISALSISLNLSGNHFSGHLPLEVGNLKNLAELDVSQNDLSGEFPTTLGRCNSLVALYLQGNSFKGSVPSSLQSLRGLSNLDLSGNNLSGQIPKYLEKFPLNNLNLSFNDFEGEVPMEGVFSNATAISVMGNPKLCGGVPELHLPTCTMKQSKKHRMSHKIILLISIASVAIAFVVVSTLFCCFKKKNKDLTFDSSSINAFYRISYDALLKATEGFSSTYLIGTGSSGSVYKAIFGETTVAVKVLNHQRQGVSRSFMAECEALGRIRHRNLIKILTSCSSVDFQGNDFKAIVYEFMPRGSLERWLHPDPKMENHQDNHVVGLNLLQRINVAIDVASALEYLHRHCHTPIIHCDLKPSNILLDADMVAHVGDFGLARLILEMNPNKSSTSVGVRGTIGYAAPEYGLGSEISREGDVYSFGILLLEMMTGKRPTESVFQAGLNLHTFARMAIPDHVMAIVDSKLVCNDEEEVAASTNNEGRRATPCPRNGNNKNDSLIRMIKIRVACSIESPQDRLDISNVVRELKLTRDIFQGLQKGNNG